MVAMWMVGVLIDSNLTPMASSACVKLTRNVAMRSRRRSASSRLLALRLE